MNKIFYRPKQSWVGDLIPFTEQNQFYLFFLNDARKTDVIADKTTWNLITTDDFINIEDKGVILPIGNMEQPDRCCYTGSVLKDPAGKYHMFYTAQNPENPAFCKDGKPLQYIIHATSADLIHWEKHYDQRFSADGAIYEPFDWRDPYVFYNDAEHLYNMLLAARNHPSSFRRGGCTVICRSDDLIHWRIGEAFFDPEMYLTHECPDLFKMGDWWYLVYSTFSDKFVTHYRMSKSLKGPWLSPQIDTFDARGLYAAKTAANPKGRFVFGWIPTKQNGNDFSPWQWGGNMAVHQLVQQQDGTLAVKIPDSIYAIFAHSIAPKTISSFGEVVEREKSITVHAPEKMSYSIFDNLPEQCLIEAEIRFSEGILSFGIDLHLGNTLDDGYFYRFEPFYNRLVFDMWPRCNQRIQQHQLAGDQQFLVAFERPIDFTKLDKIFIKLIVDGDIGILYVNDTTALSTRTYNLNQNKKWGFFAYGGTITITNIQIKTPNF